MASIRCPLNVSSITFSSSGVKTPDAAGVVTGLTSAEANALRDRYQVRAVGQTAGALSISMPTVVTGLTINGTAYTVTGAVTPWGKVLNATVPAADASDFLYQNFSLVQG